MSIRLMSKIWDHSVAVTHERLIVLLALSDWANDDGECWPKIATIATKARLTERGVKGILAWLENEGYLTIQHGRGRGNSSRYLIHHLPVKRETASPFIDDVKGEAGSVKGEADDIEKVKRVPLKGEAGSVKGEADDIEHIRYAGAEPLEPSVQPSLEPSRRRTPQNQKSNFQSDPIQKFPEITEAVFTALGVKQKSRYEMGTISRYRKIEIQKVVGMMAHENRTREEILKFADNWPKIFPNKENVDPPTPSQMLDKFDEVLSWQPRGSGSKKKMTFDEQMAHIAEIKRKKAEGTYL